PSDLGVGFLVDQYGNPNLKWESTNNYNLGFNLGLLKNRINIEGDVYVKNVDNLLMQKPLPWFMGTSGIGAAGNPNTNIGKLQTKGWGVTINTVNINNSRITWQSSLNLSGFKTNIKSFYSDAAFVDRISWWLDNWTQRSAVNHAPWLFRGYVADGLFQSLDDIAKSPVRVDNNGNRLPADATTGVWVGDVKFKDLNGDNKIDFNDETFIGNPWPKLFGGFTNTFTYKGFDLSILVTGTFGQDIYNQIA